MVWFVSLLNKPDQTLYQAASIDDLGRDCGDDCHCNDDDKIVDDDDDDDGRADDDDCADDAFFKTFVHLLTNGPLLVKKRRHSPNF